MERMLYGFCRDLPVWAIWRPIEPRLRIWSSLKPELRLALRDILDLEGPDFECRRYGTLRHGLLAVHDYTGEPFRMRHMQVIPEPSLEMGTYGLLERLFTTLDRICSVSPECLELMAYICIQDRLNGTALDILDHVRQSRDSSLASFVLGMLTAPSENARMGSVMRLIPLLAPNDGGGNDPNQFLRTHFSSRITTIIEKTLAKMQNTFCEQLQRGRSADGPGMKLHAFGVGLKQSPWTVSLLDERWQALLTQWPSKENISAAFSLRIDVANGARRNHSTLIETIDRYCILHLAGHVDPSNLQDNLTEGLIQLWRLPPDSERRALGLAVAERLNIPSSIRHSCILRICKTNEDSIDAVGKVLREDTDMSCVNFARLLTRRNFQRAGNFVCWRDFLLCMIQERNDTILDSTVTQLPLQSWFEWLENLRTIFDVDGEEAIEGVKMLDKNLNRWSRRLRRSYMPVLVDMSTNMDSRPQMREILLGWNNENINISILERKKRGE
ncbi:uncharacterized protein BDZ99DRAFT_237651 [Mytilinidion resinicola]|uniref:Uncharacterized protein n=1 Tax=Mytilinidion resinicola TaxID=574789 RepID=A0A6A6Z2N3_9PEZI|nr:uncharacterized protein BDZ99DRAFT_237651 [Mytilinidion resinicola]KAF2814445.1 hypothetical protein BDZ99DRAFT_237651 [Mytilinidion resinicola]